MAKVTYEKLSQDDPLLSGDFVGPGGYSMERLKSIGQSESDEAESSEARERSLAQMREYAKTRGLGASDLQGLDPEEVRELLEALAPSAPTETPSPSTTSSNEQAKKRRSNGKTDATNEGDDDGS